MRQQVHKSGVVDQDSNNKQDALDGVFSGSKPVAAAQDPQDSDKAAVVPWTFVITGRVRAGAGFESSQVYAGLSHGS